MAYQGDERRIHKVYVTRNTEYHVRRGLCVGVRDRRSGKWLGAHLACGSRLAGGLRFGGQGGFVPNPGTPSLGESIFFCAAGRDVVTSPLTAVERPARDMVGLYPA
jgi:hypothetical protein